MKISKVLKETKKLFGIGPSGVLALLVALYINGNLVIASVDDLMMVALICIMVTAIAQAAMLFWKLVW